MLPDGEVVTLGGGSTEHVGPDWTGMFCGSEGLFGIALEVTLRLIPIPESVRTSLAVYDSLEAAGDAVAEIVGAGLLPVAMEIMDALAMQAAEASVKPGYPPGAALLIVELEGEREVVDADARALDAFARGLGGDGDADNRGRRGARADLERAARARSRPSGGCRPTTSCRTGSCRAPGWARRLAEIDRMSAAAGIRVANVFHAGDGNLHPLILFDGREPGALERAEGLAGDILRLCVDLGGSITGEHGVGVEKREYLALMFSEDDLELMRRIRAAVDPAELANRGKMLEPTVTT